MAQVPENAGTGDYVKAPETYQREMPVGEQLLQMKDTASRKVNEFADQTNLRYNQAQNDPANPASDQKLARDVDTTAEHAANSVELAKSQLSGAADAVAQSLGQMKGAFMATQNRGTTATPTSAPNPPAANPSAATETPTSLPNVPASRRPASVSESLGQTAGVVTDAVKNLFGSRTTTPGSQPGLNNMNTTTPGSQPGLNNMNTTTPGSQPGLHNMNTDMPQDVPHRAPQ